ncbi:MAG: hypothetical protein GWO08_15155, partial [Gammaproteobacteria bacterium]|nr:hypothetical protein [Gammaproteobacteria bacterium]NIR65925.1 hypothetical protein [candidate division Zixibacteria bacterium]NIQ74767.1 hypothetical protein [Gammaproteobacteria bacterium]NIR94947.1 hypothetical protein [Gammaproteobacteria bacterium]NIU15656.1 hypothetical protein [candidate division Zixibacteria bacterium]
MKTILTPVFLFMLFPVLCRATTWDEPWMDTVIKNADVFVKADITEKTPDGIKARLLKHLAGEKIPEKFDITG